MKIVNSIFEALIGLLILSASFYICLKVRLELFPDSDFALILSAVVASLLGGILTFKVFLPTKDYIGECNNRRRNRRTKY